MSYRAVRGSVRVARRFTITVGMRTGYVSDQQWDPSLDYTGWPVPPSLREQVKEAARQWMSKRAAAKQPFVTGVFTEGTALYAYPGESETCFEPVMQFSGVLPKGFPTAPKGHENPKSSHGTLNDLASTLGEAVRQIRVYVEFEGETWILQKEGAEYPGSLRKSS